MNIASRSSPEHHRRLALASAALLGLVVLFGALSALVLHAELWRPTQDFISAKTYNAVFTWHGALITFGTLYGAPLLIVGHLFLYARRQSNVPALWLGRLSLTLWVISMLWVATLLATHDTAAPKEAFAPGSLAFVWLGLAADVFAGASIFVAALSRNTTQAFRPSHSAVGFALMLAAALTLFQTPLHALFQSAAPSQFLPREAPLPMLATPRFIIIVAIAQLSGVDHQPQWRRRVCLGLIAFMFTGVGVGAWSVLTNAPPPAWLSTLDDGYSTLANLFLLSVLAGAVVSRLDTKSRTWALSLFASYVVVSLVIAYMSSLESDTHVADTYLSVASFHGVFCLMLVALVVASRDLLVGETEAVRLSSERFLAIVTGLSLIGMTAATATLGYQGMPRRYYAYLPEYEDLHRVLGVCAAVFVGSLIAGALAFVRAARRHKVPS